MEEQITENLDQQKEEPNYYKRDGKKEEFAIVLDYLPYGYPLENKMLPIAQAIGLRNLTLLQLIPRRGLTFELKELFSKLFSDSSIGDNASPTAVYQEASLILYLLFRVESAGPIFDGSFSWVRAICSMLLIAEPFPVIIIPAGRSSFRFSLFS